MAKPSALTWMKSQTVKDAAGESGIKKGFEDGKKDSGWIPVEEKRVPEKGSDLHKIVYNEMMIGYVYYSEEMKLV